MSAAQDAANALAQAGFTGDNLVTAIAISLAEDPSSDPYAHCLNCGGVAEDSQGIMQINVLAHPQYAGGSMYDDVSNAQAAYAISGGSNFTAWATYLGGEYLTHWSMAQGLAANATASGIVASPPSSAASGAQPGNPSTGTQSQGISKGAIALGIAAVLTLAVIAVES